MYSRDPSGTWSMDFDGSIDLAAVWRKVSMYRA